MLKPRLLCIALAWAAGCGGCSDYYLDRRDTIFLGTGDAVQTNIVAHQIDPWPAHARRTNGATNGERLQRAIERYRNPRSGRDAAGSSDAAGAQAGAQSPSPAPSRAP